MPSLYDRLTDQLDDDKTPGLTPLDMADLPDDQRRIMFYLLREPSAASGGVPLATIEAQFDDIDDVPEILDELGKNQWLIVMGEPPNTRYKVNLRRKRGSKKGSLWTSLADRLTDDDSP